MNEYNFDPGMGTFTVGKLLRFAKKMAIALAVYALVSAAVIFVLQNFPKYSVEWSYWPNYKDDSFVIYDSFMHSETASEEYPADEFFMLYCRPTYKNRTFLLWSAGPSRNIMEKMNDALSVYQDRIPELHAFGVSHMPFHVETQYIYENGSSRYVILGYYTEDGIKKEIHEEYPLEINYEKKSDYGPLRYNEYLEYLPEDVAAARKKEIALNNYENRILAEEGTVFRRYKAIFYPLFTFLTLVAAYAVFKFYRRYYPKYGMEFIHNTDDPSAEFYFIIPSPTVDSSLFGRIKNAPAEHIIKEHREMIEARDALRAYCEEFEDRLPARFEAIYSVSVSGSRFVLRGYCTENGIRRDIEDTYYFDFIHYHDTAMPPEELRPDLRYGQEIKVSQNILK